MLLLRRVLSVPALEQVPSSVSLLSLFTDEEIRLRIAKMLAQSQMHSMLQS